jgi:hypothetical protein
MSYGAANNDPIDRQTADVIAGLSVSVALHADKPLKDLKSVKSGNGSSPDPQAAAELDALKADYQLIDRNGKTLIEFRQLGKSGYLHGDIDALAKLGGVDPAAIHQGLDQAGPDLGPIKDALTGGWVELDAQTLQDFGGKAAAGGNGAGGITMDPSAKPSLDPQTSKDLADSIKRIFTGDFTFESKGKANGADQIEVTAPFRKLAGDLLDALKPVAAKLPAGKDGKFPQSLPTDTPDKNVTAELMIKDGALSSATFDLAQLDKKSSGSAHLPLLLSFDRNAPAVQVPEHATKLTENDLENAVGALMMTVAGRGGDPADGLPGGLAGLGGNDGNGANDGQA